MESCVYISKNFKENRMFIILKSINITLPSFILLNTVWDELAKHKQTHSANDVVSC